MQLLCLAYIAFNLLLFLPSHARVLERGTSAYKLGGHLLSRQDASDDTDACVIACSPDTCNSNNCALSTSKRDLMTGFEYASNGTYDDHALPKTLVRRKFDDPLDAKQYVSQQVQKISGAQSIRPASADGVSNPSFCIQQIFADLPLDQGQRVFGTAEDQRVRGCTVLTVVGARGFYMCHLYENYHFMNSEKAFVGIQPVQNLITNQPPSDKIRGPALAVDLFNQPSDGTALFVMTPRSAARPNDASKPAYQPEIDALVGTIRGLLPGIKAVSYNYHAFRDQVSFTEPYQGYAFLEWDPDATGQSAEILRANPGTTAPAGLAQWRLWYENTYVSGLVDSGLEDCLRSGKALPVPDSEPEVAYAVPPNTQESSCDDPNSAKRDIFDTQDGNSTLHVYDALSERGFLEKRATKTFQWMSDNGKSYPIPMGNYPRCGDAITKDEVDKYYGFEAISDPPSSCPIRMRKLPAELVPPGGSGYATEHVFEPQLYKIFFEWLVGRQSVAKFNIQMPTGYRPATSSWLESKVLGVGDGATPFAFTDYDGSQAPDLSKALINAIGTGSALYRFTLLEKSPNNYKGKWLSGQTPILSTKKMSLRAMKIKQRDAIGALQYLQFESVWNKYTQSSSAAEQSFKAFDAAYPWNSDQGEPGRPQRQSDQPSAGLRDLWCYFLDAWHKRVDQTTTAWAATTADAIRVLDEVQKGGAYTAIANAWIQNFIEGPNAPMKQLNLPKPNPDLQNPPQGQLVRGSPYGLWNVNGVTGDAGPW